MVVPRKVAAKDLAKAAVKDLKNLLTKVPVKVARKPVAKHLVRHPARKAVRLVRRVDH